MKKFVLLLVASMLLSVASAFAQGGTTGPLTWNLEDGTLTISGEGDMPYYDVYAGDYAPWYKYHLSIYNVVIEDGVTNVGVYAFHNCTRIASVSLSNSVTNIEDRAFDFCAALTSIDIPNSVTRIGGGAFAYCRDLSSVIIPESVTTIGPLAFYYCVNLPSITIPNSVTEIGPNAFYICTHLTSITLSNSLTAIEYGTFANCVSLLSITIPEGVTRIEDGAFEFCTHLLSAIIPESVTEIGYDAFYWCISLNSVTNYNPVPVYISGSVFHGVVHNACDLKVPKGSVSAYKNANEWKKFRIVEIEETVGIEPIEDDVVKIFPNPTRGELIIDNGQLTIENVEIFDVMGRTVGANLCVRLVETRHATSLQPQRLNLSHLPAGIYFVRIQTDKGTVTKKIIKQ
jgi:hypothetical protein